MTNPRPPFRIPRFVVFLLAAIPFSSFTLVPAARGQAMALAAVPDSPLELVNGSARAVITPEGRDMAMDLLARARQNLTLHAAGVPPFQMKVSFIRSHQAAIRNSKATERWRNSTRARCCAGPSD